jgi:hypothetical protein
MKAAPPKMRPASLLRNACGLAACVRIGGSYEKVYAPMDSLHSNITQAVEAEFASFLETQADKLTEDGHTGGWYATAICQNARSRLASASSACANHVSVTEGCNEKSASAFCRRSCHPMRAARPVNRLQ